MTDRIATIEVFRTELVRKSIHFLISLSPVMAVINRPFTLVFLTTGVLLYIFLESLRMRGVSVPFFSSLTAQVSRPHDMGRFVMGPVSLGLGAILVLALFPPQTAAIAIYALAFGDGFASLLGRPFGIIRPNFLFGKSVEGSLACFCAVFYCTWSVSRSLSISLIAALTAATVEALPLEDLDNIVMPLAVALVVSLI
jgi:dolichol kinase